MAVTSRQEIDAQVDPLTVLFELLDRLEPFLASQVGNNGFWDTRISQVDSMVKRLFDDAGLQQVAHAHVTRIIAKLRSYRVAPPGVLDHFARLQAEFDFGLASFEAVMDWYYPEEFGVLLDRWARKIDGQFYMHRPQVRTTVDKICRETERRVRKLKKKARCPIAPVEVEELD